MEYERLAGLKTRLLKHYDRVVGCLVTGLEDREHRVGGLRRSCCLLRPRDVLQRQGRAVARDRARGLHEHRLLGLELFDHQLVGRRVAGDGGAYAMPAARGVGLMNAPMIHRKGKKNPIQNIQ